MAYQSVFVQELVRKATGIPARAVKPSSDKETRFLGIVPLFEQGLMFLADTLPYEFEQEIVAFPLGEHDDYCDALVYAVEGAAGRTGNVTDRFQAGIAAIERGKQAAAALAAGFDPNDYHIIVDANGRESDGANHGLPKSDRRHAPLAELVAHIEDGCGLKEGAVKTEVAAIGKRLRACFPPERMADPNPATLFRADYFTWRLALPGEADGGGIPEPARRYDPSNPCSPFWLRVGAWKTPYGEILQGGSLYFGAPHAAPWIAPKK